MMEDLFVVIGVWQSSREYEAWGGTNAVTVTEAELGEAILDAWRDLRGYDAHTWVETRRLR